MAPPPNWTDLPLSHPVPFSSILLCLDNPREVLACRAVCSSWRSWFSASSSLWSKYLSRHLCQDSVLSSPEDDQQAFLVAYRRRKILEARTEREGDCLRLAVILSRARQEVCPPVSLETMKLVKTLELSVPVLAPPALFIRLKVDDPVVRKIIVELLSKYLSCICLNKQVILRHNQTIIIENHEKTSQDMADNDEVRTFVLRQTWGPNGSQNWVYVNNLRNLKQEQEEKEKEEKEEEAELEGVVLEGEDKLEEALKLSLEPRGEKRKPEEESSEAAGQAKRRKEEEEEGEERADSEAEEGQSSEGEGQSIYSVAGESPPSDFPSILDVLSIDHEVVRSLLVSRCQIDKHYIVPQFDRFIQFLPKFETEDESIRLIGCDSDGKVVSVQPSQFNNVGDTMVGYIETPFTFTDHARLLTAWGGPDIRDRWPQFSSQLAAMAEEKEKPRKKVAEPSPPVGVAGPSRAAPSSESDILALLAARGVSIVKK